jgi:hypothetical protein
MINDKIAVIIVGERNSGKTATIKYFRREFDESKKEVIQCRIGWRRIQLFLHRLDALSCLIYFIPSSPSESNIPLEMSLKEFKPEMLLIAEQLNGKEYHSTKNFLVDNGYEIIEFTITKNNSLKIWRFWNDIEKKEILTERAKIIGNAFSKYVLSTITQ